MPPKHLRVEGEDRKYKELQEGSMVSYLWKCYQIFFLKVTGSPKVQTLSSLEIWRLRWKKSESFSKSTSQQEDKRHEGTRWIGACIAQNSLCLLFSMEPQKQIPLPTSYFHICFAQIHQLLLIIFFLPLCICITIYNTNMHISAYVYTCTHFPKTIQNRTRDTFLYL